MKIFEIPATHDGVEIGLKQIKNTLKNYHFKGRKLQEGLAKCEEAFGALLSCTEPESEIRVKITRFYSTAKITMSAPGSDCEKRNDTTAYGNIAEKQSIEAMRELTRAVNAEGLTYKYKDGCNTILIEAGDKERLFAIRTIAALVFATITALAVQLLLPGAFVEGCIHYVLEPFQTLFLNTLQLVTAPAVFFSIMTAVARFASFSDLGRIEKKAIWGHIISAVISVAIAIVLFLIADPAYDSSGILSNMVQNGGHSSSIMEMITKSVPNNIISPFLNVDSLQLLVVSILCGIALAKAGTESIILNEISMALHKFFSTIVDIVSNLIPTAVFFVTMLLLLSFGFEAMVISLRIFVLVVLGFAVLILIAGLSVPVLCGLNPLPFYLKMQKYMLKVFWRGSSVSAVPDTMAFCEEQLGVSQEVSNFTIPFGAIANLDGNCLYMTIAGLTLTQLCGTHILGQDFATIAFMVMVLSIGSAITPGSAMLALILLMGQMKVSLTAICLLLGINAIIEMLLAMSNNYREVASTLIIARKEGLLNMSVYLSRKGKM